MYICTKKKNHLPLFCRVAVCLVLKFQCFFWTSFEHVLKEDTLIILWGSEDLATGTELIALSLEHINLSSEQPERAINYKALKFGWGVYCSFKKTLMGKCNNTLPWKEENISQIHPNFTCETVFQNDPKCRRSGYFKSFIRTTTSSIFSFHHCVQTHSYLPNRYSDPWWTYQPQTLFPNFLIFWALEASNSSQDRTIQVMWQLEADRPGRTG